MGLPCPYNFEVMPDEELKDTMQRLASMMFATNLFVPVETTRSRVPLGYQECYDEMKKRNLLNKSVG